MRKLLLLPFIFVAAFSFTHAGTVPGAEITYRSTGNKVFEVTLKIYRDCRGIPLGNPSYFYVQCTTGGSQRTFSYSKVSIKDVTPRCSTSSAPCTPQNTVVGTEGYEEHTYVGTIDFNASPLNGDVAGGCCTFRVVWYECCRSGAINTGTAAEFFVDALIDVCKAPTNSSPVFTGSAFLTMCCNQPFTYNPGSSDPDGDSLVHRLVAAKETSGTNFSYAGGYSSTRPLTPYFPAGWANPNNSNPNTNPPIGFFIDPVNGVVIFTPTGCNETGPVVIQVDEYRKDGSGNYQKIGEIRRDLQMTVRNCTNNPPTLGGPYSYSVCEGSQLCFNVTATDQRYGSSGPQDSLDLTRDTIAGATITVDPYTTVSGTTSSRALHFCWTPPVGKARSFPYKLNVTASDRVCSPGPASITKTYSVYVKPLTNASIQKTVLQCGKLKLEAVPNESTTNAFSWLLRDSTNKPLTLTYADKVSSTKQVDTIQFKKPGKYILVLQANNAGNCPRTYMDTVVIPNDIVEVKTPPDTLVCRNIQTTLSAGVSNGHTPYSYRWQVSADSGAADTNASYVFKPLNNNLVSLTVTDAHGCTAKTSFNVKVSGTFSLSDGNVCRGDSALIQGPAGWSSYSWNTGAVTRNIRVADAGMYILQATDSNTCAHRDTMVLDTLPLPVPDLKGDTMVCKGDTITLMVNSGYSSYSWNTGASTTQIPVTSAGKYKVTVTNNLGCIGRDSMQVLRDSVPVSDLLFTDQIISNRRYTFIPSKVSGVSHYWTFGDGGSSADTVPTHQYATWGFYTVCHRVTSGSGCIDSLCRTLEVKSISVGKLSDNAFAIDVYPNPFHDGTLVSLQLDKQATVSISLYDVLGREYVVTHNETAAPGQLTRAVNSEELHLPAGMLILKVTVNGADAYLRLVKVN